MISIIVCHRNSNYLGQLKKNISGTIGIPYELIVIDNTTNKYNIFQAYNLGIKQCRYDILCFTHEDILFHTQNWGKKVVDHFQNPQLGIIGVSGSHYVPKLPGSWWSSCIVSYNVMGQPQLLLGRDIKKNVRDINGNIADHSLYRYVDNTDTSIQAVILDGLWLCIPKTVMRKVRFDDITFSGFHCYDSDICLQIKKLHYDIKIVFDINIEHFSFGSTDKVWLKNIFLFYNKWKKELPISCISLTKAEIGKAHYENAKELLELIKINKLKIIYNIKVIYYYFRYTPLYSMLTTILRMYIVKKYPEINYYNPLKNSFKYILRKKFH